MLAYTSVPYTLVMQQETHPTLQSNPKSFAASREKGSHWFFFFVTKLASFLGIVAVVMSMVWVATVLFDDKIVRNTYGTTTFFTSLDKSNIDAWQVLSQAWSELSKPTPTTDIKFNHYFECWFAAGVLSTVCTNSSVAEYKTCVTSKYPTQLTTCSNAHDEALHSSPSFNEYTRCIQSSFALDRSTSDALRICLRTNLWPLYESPEQTDSWNFLGSYNWMIFLTVGFALFATFVLYTGGFVMNAEALEIVTPGKPAKNGPLSYSVTGICAVLSFLFFLYFLINAYRAPTSTSTYILPNSIATNNIMILTSIIVFVYFVVELLEMWNPSEVRDMIKIVYSNNNMNKAIIQAHNMPHAATYDPSWKSTINNYYPALTLAWADGYMLDPVIVAGVIGATQQVNTAILYQIFVAVFTYRLAHTAVARFMYEGYIYNPDEAEGKFTKERTGARLELYAVRMQAMFMHLSATMALVMLWYILTNTNYIMSEFTLVYLMLYLWFVVPEIIRLISHIIVAFKAVGTSDKYILMTSNYFLWVWDVLVRLIFIIIIFWGADSIPGTQYFLSTRLQNITDTVTYMTY